MAEDLGPVDHATWVPEQQLEQAELGRREDDRPPGTRHCPRLEIEGQVGEAERALRGVATAQESTHAQQELVQGERVNEIVVGAGIEPGHAVTHAVTGTQGQEWEVLLLLPDPAGDGHRGLLARGEVDDDGVREPGPDDAHRLQLPCGKCDVISLDRKCVPELLGAPWNRLHNEQASL